MYLGGKLLGFVSQIVSPDYYYFSFHASSRNVAILTTVLPIVLQELGKGRENRSCGEFTCKNIKFKIKKKVNSPILICPIVFVFCYCCNKLPPTDGLKPKNIFSDSSAGQKSKMDLTGMQLRMQDSLLSGGAEELSLNCL